MSEITSRPAQDCEADCKAIFELLLVMHKEVGRHALNHVKAWNEVCACVRHGAAYMVFRGDELIGSFGLRKVTPYYSDEELLSEQWFYVRKECRDDDRALKALLAGCRAVSDETGYPAQIKIYDPRRQSRSKTATIAEDFFFRPAGKVRLMWPSYRVA